MPKEIYYLPLLRTRAAELKAYEFVHKRVAKNMLPIFELTRARRTKVDKEGDIQKNVSRIKEIVGESPFVLDLTTTDQLSNRTIDRMVNTSKDGFPLWVNLVREFDDQNIIPAIHLDLNNLDYVSDEIKALESLSELLFFRLDLTYDPYGDLEALFRVLGDKSKLILMLDAGFVDINSSATRSRNIGLVNDISNKYGDDVSALVYSSSSFPASVVKKGYGGYDYGSFELTETTFYDRIENVTSCYSDYATIHPNFYPGGGGWVPRIDFPLSNDLFYYRYKRDDGGYIRAAEDVVNSSIYSPIESWAIDQIELASAGAPEGKSPAHWISVRMNLHMTRQVQNLKANKRSHFSL